MSDYDLRELILSGNSPQNVRLLMAKGVAPLPAGQMIEILVYLRGDNDEEIAAQAHQTLSGWDNAEIIALVSNKECPERVLDFFADALESDVIQQKIIANPATSGKTIARMAPGVTPALLDAILDNRTRILEYPDILDAIRRNPAASTRTLGVVKEIETEFLGAKRTDYSIEATPEESADAPEESALAENIIDFEAEIAMLLASPPPADIELSLEGLPFEDTEDDANISSRISTMPVRDKLKYALFGTREIRAILIRDTNREVARAVLHSPKLRENEVEGIAAMRNVSDDIIREIGNSREWLKNSIIVQNLVKNPKTPPLIAMRLMPRLRLPELRLLSRDRSIPDATRNNALRLIKQRMAATGGHR